MAEGLCELPHSQRDEPPAVGDLNRLLGTVTELVVMPVEGTTAL